MNVFCYAVGAAIAEKVIASDLEKHGLLISAVIAERIGDEAKVRWPHIHEAVVGTAVIPGVRASIAVSVYRKLLIRTTSLVSLPRATNNCLPSRDQENAKIRPEVKSVT